MTFYQRLLICFRDGLSSCEQNLNDKSQLARSVNLAYPASLQVNTGIDDTVQISTFKPEKAKVKPELPKTGYIRLDTLPLATNLVYGLVNIRSDGKYILCATMKETNNDFD